MPHNTSDLPTLQLPHEDPRAARQMSRDGQVNSSQTREPRHITLIPGDVIDLQRTKYRFERDPSSNEELERLKVVEK